jgi:hypothetical protein
VLRKAIITRSKSLITRKKLFKRARPQAGRLVNLKVARIFKRILEAWNSA